MSSPERDPHAALISPPEAGSAPVDRCLEQAHDNWRSTWQERRAQQRYPLDNPFTCHLQLHSGPFPSMPVQLQDISLGGACLLISSLVQLRRGDMGELRRHAQGDPGTDPLERRRLRICWQEVREWITAVGVAFEPPLEALPVPLE